MQSGAKTTKEYIDSLPEDRAKAISSVRKEILKNLPKGYKETMQYGMISYVIPLKDYPDTYNGQALGIAALASQKNYMSVYLMNVYSDPKLESWFVKEYKATGKKLDMGKSCIRFKKIEDLPIELIGKAVASTPPDKFIKIYEEAQSRR